MFDQARSPGYGQVSGPPVSHVQFQPIHGGSKLLPKNESIDTATGYQARKGWKCRNGTDAL